MNNTDQLEAELLQLPPRERERLALAAWASLEEAGGWLADPKTDPAGVALALTRDVTIESGEVKPITLEEFRRRTRGNAE